MNIYGQLQVVDHYFKIHRGSYPAVYMHVYLDIFYTISY